MNEKQKKRTGKFISLILRHNPEKIGLTLDDSGWASVDELLAGLKTKGHRTSFEQLNEIVETNDKKRYSFNEDKSKIRANQGHSLNLDLQLEKCEPPEVLYHGTASRYMASIREQGLVKGNRHHVHLSSEKDTASNVGSRHGVPVILAIAAGHMHREGYDFYCSKNGVWLTDFVPAKYFSN